MSKFFGKKVTLYTLFTARGANYKVLQPPISAIYRIIIEIEQTLLPLVSLALQAQHRSNALGDGLTHRLDIRR